MELSSLLVLVAVLALAVLTLSVLFSLLLVGAALTRVPFMPVSMSVLKALPQLMPLPEAANFYDLGCGDGRVVIAMGAAFPHATCIGVEIAPLPYLLARWRLWRSGLSNVSIILQSFYSLKLDTATHVYLYQNTYIMDALLPKLEGELPKGAIVVATDSTFTDKKPVAVRPVGTGGNAHTLREYVF